MRLNIHCVRLVLLAIEELQQIEKDGILNPLGVKDLVAHLKNKGFGQKEIFYTVKQLLDSQLIEGHVHITGHQHNYVIQDLSPKGHAFLENIRSPQRWEEIMELCEKVQSYSLPLVEELASTLAFNKTRQLVAQNEPTLQELDTLEPCPPPQPEPLTQILGEPLPPPQPLSTTPQFSYFPALDPAPLPDYEEYDQNWTPPPLPYVDDWPTDFDSLSSWTPPNIEELESTIRELEAIYLNTDTVAREAPPPYFSSFELEGAAFSKKAPPLITFQDEVNEIIDDEVRNLPLITFQDEFIEEDDDDENPNDPLEIGFSL